MDGSIKDISQIEKTTVAIIIPVLLAVVFLGGYMYLPSFAGETNLIDLSINFHKKEQSNALFYLDEIVKETPVQISLKEKLEKKYRTAVSKEVAPGVVHIRFSKLINSKPIKVNVVEINKNINPGIEVLPVLAGNSIHSKAKIRDIAKKNNSIVAINGTYFKPATGTPLGVLMIDNKLVTGPIYNRVALGISQNGYTMSRSDVNGTIKINGNEIKIDNINQPRMLSAYTLVYTKEWGNFAPVTGPQHITFAVKENKIVSISHSQALAIPKNGFVISAPAGKFKNIKIADKAEFQLDVNSKLQKSEHIISGGPYLVKDGKIFVDTNEEKLNAITGKNPRTAIGYTEDNRLILVTIDGREETSVGITLKDLSILMQSFGCTQAMNLDGGSSTVMFVDGKIVNSPNTKGGILISNALTINIPDKIANNE